MRDMVREQQLKTAIEEGQTLLKGKMPLPKRQMIERSVTSAQRKLEELRQEDKERG